MQTNVRRIEQNARRDIVRSHVKPVWTQVHLQNRPGPEWSDRSVR